MLKMLTMVQSKKRAHGIKGNYDSVTSKADQCFDVYLAMNPPRSLNTLQVRLPEVGLDISLSSLKAYSSRFKWQDRLNEARKIMTTNQAQQAAKELMNMADRHARIGETLQALGIGEVRYLMSQDPSKRRLSSSESARTLESAIRVERLARGEVTDRTELQIRAVNLIVSQVVDVFAEVATKHHISNEAVSEFAFRAEQIAVAASQQATAEAEFSNA